MNWGTKLIIGMSLFMAFIITLGIFMIRSEADALVDNDYYEKGLSYDDEYSRKELAINDKVVPTIMLSDDRLIMTFKTESAGTLKIIRTAKKSMDRVMNFKTDSSGILILNTEDLAKGPWKFVIQWKAGNGRRYLNEQEALIP